MITRRGLLQGSIGALALGGGLPNILERVLAAQAVQGAPRNRRVLVILQLTGGNDGLNTVIPFADDAYWKARPNIAPPKNDVRKIADTTALHPSMKKLEAAFKEGRLAVIQSVGYPHPNRSHFHSMDVWHTADPELQETRTGWLGRALDRSPDAKDNALYAFHLGDELPRMLLSRSQRVTAFSSIQDYTMRPDNNAPNDRPRIEKAFAGMMDPKDAEAGAGLALVRKTAAQAIASAAELKDVLAKSATNAIYPGTGLGQQLKLAAQMIGAELPVHVVSLQIGGFDTHANQKPQHANLWTQIDDALAAFHDDLAARNRADDVVVFSFSEFGRRVAENGSGGTDHGAAAPALLFGKLVKGSVVGVPPSLADLDDGDTKFAVDFRRIYATLLDRWLGVDSAAVLGSSFEPLDLVPAQSA